MKVERWYDICCMLCGKYLSTDFNYGMQPTREDAVRCAKECGFEDVNSLTVCPECVAKMKSKECVNMTETKDKMVESHSVKEINEEKKEGIKK